MIINKLELENFGVTTDKQVIKFRKGINLITGNNGKGKSTALKALALSLFNYSKGRHQDYINWDKDWFKTKLNLEHLGHNYDIEFSAGKGTEGKILNIDNNDYYERSEANSKLEELFNPKLMLASMISFEGETDLITVKPAERREHLKKIYDLDFKAEIQRLKLLIDKLNDEDISKIKDEILVLESAEYDINILPELLFSHEDYVSYKDLFKSNSDKIRKIIEANSVKTQKLQEKEKLELQVSDLELSLKAAKLKSENLISEKNGKKEPNYNSKLVLLEEELKSLNDSNIEAIEIKILSYKKKRPIKIDENKLTELLLNKNNIQNEISNLNKKLKDLDSGICPTCGSSIDSTDIREWTKKLNILNESLDNIIKEIDDYKVKIKEKEKIDDFNLNISNLINNDRIKIDKLKTENLNKKSNLETSIANEKELILSAKKSFLLETEIINNKILEVNNTISNKEEEIKKLEEETKIIEKSIEKTNDETTDELEKENDLINTKISDYDKISIKRDLIGNKNKSETIKKKENLEKISKLIIERDTLASEVAEYLEQKDILNKKFPSYVIATLIKTIEHEMNDFIIKTYEGKYKIKILEKKDAIYVVYGEKQVDVSLASGYEKQIFSLAYKNALNKISGTGVLILDEVDSASSIENSLQLYKIVGSMTDLYQQIIIITHKPEVQELLINEYNALAYEVDNGIFRRIV